MIQLRGTGNLHHIAQTASNDILNSGMSCHLVERVSEAHGEVQLVVQVFEKYYMRVSNRVSLTLTLVAVGDAVTAYCIGSGGGQGPIFAMSWGAEENFAITAAQALERQGFLRID